MQENLCLSTLAERHHVGGFNSREIKVWPLIKIDLWLSGWAKNERRVKERLRPKAP